MSDLLQEKLRQQQARIEQQEERIVTLKAERDELRQRLLRLAAENKESYQLTDVLMWAVGNGISVFQATDTRFYARKTTDFRASTIIGAPKGVEGPQAAVQAAREARQ